MTWFFEDLAASHHPMTTRGVPEKTSAICGLLLVVAGRCGFESAAPGAALDYSDVFRNARRVQLTPGCRNDGSAS
jgi:hypothetical protein